MYAVPMINDAPLFILFKACQQRLQPVPFDKQVEAIGFYLGQNAFMTVFLAKIARAQFLLCGARSVFTVAGSWTRSGFAAMTAIVFRAQAAGQAASCDAQFSFHVCNIPIWFLILRQHRTNQKMTGKPTDTAAPPDTTPACCVFLCFFILNHNGKKESCGLKL